MTLQLAMWPIRPAHSKPSGFELSFVSTILGSHHRLQLLTVTGSFQEESQIAWLG